MKPTTVVRILFADGNKASFATTDADKLLPIIVAAPGWCGLETVIIDPDAPLVEQLREALYPINAAVIPMAPAPVRVPVVGEVWKLTKKPDAGYPSPSMVMVAAIDGDNVLVKAYGTDPSEVPPLQWSWWHSYLNEHYAVSHIAASSLSSSVVDAFFPPDVATLIVEPGSIWVRKPEASRALPACVQVLRSDSDLVPAPRMVDVDPVRQIKGSDKVRSVDEHAVAITWQLADLLASYDHGWTNTERYRKE